MKNTEKISEEVRRFILDLARSRAGRLGIDIKEALNGKASLINSGLFDSFGFMELLAEIEKKFSIELDLSEHDPAEFTKTDGLVAITAGLVSGASRAPESAAAPYKNGTSSFSELSPTHPLWKQLPKLFHEMYEYFAQHGFKSSLRERGGDIWLQSLGATVGKTTQVIGYLHNGQLAGFVHCTLKLLPVFFQESLAGVIEHIYVRPEYRRQNIAKELVIRAEAWLRKKKAKRIELLVLSGNKTGIEFWNKSGFVEELVQMQKDLDLSS